MGLGVMVYPFEWFWRNAQCISHGTIDDIDLISTLSNAHEEVVRFDIAMNEVRVDGVGGQIFCHRSSSDAKSMSYSICTVSRVAMSLSNSMTESDNLITLGLNTVYLSEWSWRNAQCTRQNRLDEKGPRLLTQM